MLNRFGINKTGTYSFSNRVDGFTRAVRNQIEMKLFYISLRVGIFSRQNATLNLKILLSPTHSNNVDNMNIGDKLSLGQFVHFLYNYPVFIYMFLSRLIKTIKRLWVMCISLLWARLKTYPRFYPYPQTQAHLTKAKKQHKFTFWIIFCGKI